jgi:glutamine synthetase
VGPCEGIEIGDHLWVARYILKRVAEDYNISISFEPKLFLDWAGSGGHINYSTEKMREGDGGMSYIENIIVARL